MSFAWPRSPPLLPTTPSCGGEGGVCVPPLPLVFDMATSAMALGDVQLHAKAGKRLPPATGLDACGRDTQDASAIVNGGVLLPFGGYKGSNISMMIELLAGPLLGETTSCQTLQHDDACGPPLGGQLIVALSPDLFAGEGIDWEEGAEEFITRLSGMEGVRIPGERRHRARLDKGPRHVRADLFKEIHTLI